LNPAKKLMRNLISDVKSKYQIGIHPSYSSHANEAILKSEIERLNTTLSRQHYIKFELPTTFRALIKNGITDDYSMGYGTLNGFRASTSFAHDWFDLLKNEQTLLRLHPFCYMDCNSFFQQKSTPNEAYLEMTHYQHIIQQVGGVYISIWHNFSLGTDSLWKGWKEIYMKIFEELNDRKGK
jgi:hypothetical protein